MICPECHAEYLNHIKECGDCEVSLINASILDLPIPEMTWLPLPPFKGKVYADMAAELLDTTVPEIRNRATITGSIEIGRHPGVVQVTFLAPAGKIDDLGLLGFANDQY